MTSSRAVAVLAAAVVLAACDWNGDITIHPEVDQTWGFEMGLEGWTAGSADAGTATWSVDATTEAASRGAGSARLLLQGAAPPTKVWLQRSFEVDTLRAYDVTVEYDLGSSEADTDAPWELVAGAGGTPLTGMLLPARGATEGEAGGGLHWVHRSHTFTATSGADGTLWFGLGVAPASAGDRTYYVDDVSLTLLRR